MVKVHASKAAPKSGHTSPSTLTSRQGTFGIQSALGNQATLRLQRAMRSAAAHVSISSPSDAHEQDASRDAARVLSMSAPDAASEPRAGARECRSTEGGQPLSEATRAFFQPRFGHDFSRVRVHAGAEAAASAQALNADAYTIGQHVVFGAGRYAPETREGLSLLAHELAHTIQHASHPLIARQKSTRPIPALPVPTVTVERGTDPRKAFVFVDGALIAVLQALELQPAVRIDSAFDATASAFTLQIATDSNVIVTFAPGAVENLGQRFKVVSITVNQSSGPFEPAPGLKSKPRLTIDAPNPELGHRSRPSTVPATSIEQTPASNPPEKEQTVGQPGFWEGIIPIWGSARSAVDHFQKGNWGRGLLYSLLAITDIFLVKSLATAAGKVLVEGAGKLVAEETIVAGEKQLAQEGGEALAKEEATTAVGESARELPKFTQTTASLTFKNGPFIGKTIGEVAAGLRSGVISAAELPVHIIIRNGQRLVIDTRSALALIRGGIDVSKWTIINRTGDAFFEKVLTERLARNKLTEAGTEVLRITGAGKGASVIR